MEKIFFGYQMLMDFDKTFNIYSSMILVDAKNKKKQLSEINKLINDSLVSMLPNITTFSE